MSAGKPAAYALRGPDGAWRFFGISAAARFLRLPTSTVAGAVKARGPIQPGSVRARVAAEFPELLPREGESSRAAR